MRRSKKNGLNAKVVASGLGIKKWNSELFTEVGECVTLPEPRFYWHFNMLILNMLKY